ncbi:MAG: Phasin [Boseongicola sp. SB0664_bin_43]|uniref:Phasin n=1 Tax=Boseongicola sp. SB0664_bin_43 TaxID=2604844 RepID=A0A6B0Y4B6_9RHOB|nr:Phasin [Boseongicola sp. SB0664_bin_43]MYK31761.1 Phasin [Boseongicola sp. SB0670_bin_30]
MTDYANGYANVMKGMFGEFPVDAGMFKNAFRQQASITDKMSRVVLAAAEKSTEISATWTKSTLGGLGNVTNAQDDLSGYTKAMSEFAIAQAELGARSLEALADVATTAQVRTFELMLASDKDPGKGASKAARKPRSESGQPASPPQVASKAARKSAKESSSTVEKVALNQ